MMNAHAQYATEYDATCHLFNCTSAKGVAKKCFDFLKQNIRYRIEPESKQTVKSLAAMVALGDTIGSDCKNYSLFVGGMLDAISRKTGKKINWCYRFASYRLFDATPHHVFVVLNPGSANETWIDAVLPTFNHRKPYTHKTDKFTSMPLYQISGIESGQVGLFRRKKKTDAPKAKRNVVLQFAAAPARNAFLALVGLNFRNLARKLDEQRRNNASRLATWWGKLGGKGDALWRAIDRGKGKRMIGDAFVIPSYSQTVGEPASAAGLAAFIAAATPVLIAVGNLLKELGSKDKDLDALDAQIDQNLANAINQQQPELPADTPGGKDNTLLLVGGAAALFLLMRKK